MAQVEVIADRIEMEYKRIVIEIAVPLDFLREAVKNPETIKAAFATAFASAMDVYLTRKNMVK